MCSINRTRVLLLTMLAVSAPANGQLYPPSEPTGGPFSRRAVLNAPFSADATTRFQLIFPDRTVREYTVTARYYRSSEGRVRAELNTPWGPYVVLAIPDDLLPDRVSFYNVDPTRRTYRLSGYFFTAMLFNGEGRVALPVARICFQTPHPVEGASDAERLRAVNAQVAEDLGVVTVSHRSDDIPVDYELSNIRRQEPPAELFDVSAYTFVEGPTDQPQMTFAPWQSPPACKPLGR